MPTITSGSLQGSDTADFIEAYNTKDAGTTLTLTPSGSVDDGNDGNNYTYTFVPVSTGVITAEALTITAATNTKVYDGTTNAAALPTITSGSLATGDTPDFTEIYSTKNVGTGLTLTPSGTVDDGNGGNNYSYTFVPVSTGTIAVSVGPAAKLVITTEPSTTAFAGQPFAVQPVIYVADQDGNIETSDNSTVVSVALASGNGLPEGTTSVTVKDGVATFIGLNEITAGTIALEFSGDGLTAGPSNNIVVSPAAPFRLKIHTQPSSTATAGQAFSTQPVIYELDLYGNLETTDNSTAITASLSFGNGPLAGSTTATVVGGVATFANLAGSSAGTIALGFSGGGLSVGPSNNVVINPTPAPTTSSEQVVKMKLTNKKGKPTGKTALEFSLKYNAAMNPALAGLHSNYQVETAVVKGTKKKTIAYKPVAFTEKYNQSTNTVTLTITGNQPFTSGGRIIINAAPPNGVSSASGFSLNANDTDYISIATKAKNIVPG